MNTRSLTELITILVVGLTILGLTIGVTIDQSKKQAVVEFREDVDFRSRNLYKLMNRDILLAGSMASSWDSTQAIEVSGDTLVIRFSELDVVRYFLDGVDRVHREDVPIANHILSFHVMEDSISIHISLDIAAANTHRWVNDGELYHRQYEWTVVPRIKDVRP